MEEREVEEADARGESKGDAAAVGGHESESAVVEVIVRLKAGLPRAGTAVEAIVKAKCAVVKEKSMVGRVWGER